MFDGHKTRRFVALSLSVLILSAGGCAARKQLSTIESPSAAACAAVLAPHVGEATIDREIARLQEAARSSAEPIGAFEQLGWKFIQKARMSFDPGFYKLAEQCAICMESKRANDRASRLLRAHALNNLHRFKEAEILARELAAGRGLSLDYAVLGDALMEQGRLDEAVGAYQKMIDMKPGPESYSRAANIRWLKGDLPGAVELMRMAAQAGSPAEPEPTAWAYTRLAMYALQGGALKVALAACDAAIGLQPDYAAALLAKSRVLLAENRFEEAISVLRHAVELTSLPEYQWTLSDALRVANLPGEAQAVEAELKTKGPSSDPRTTALFLATRGEDVETALTLARRELDTRRDVFTLDAVAWSLAATRRPAEARDMMKQALAEGTQDARLFYHAGEIAALAGETREAIRWFARASELRPMLLPLEWKQLSIELAALRK